MQLTILQGINLRSPVSMVVAKYESWKTQPNKIKEIRDLLEQIKSYHPIFAQDIKYLEDGYEVQSRLTFFWREVARVIDLHLADKPLMFTTPHGEKSGLQYETLSDALHALIQGQFKSMSTIPILASAIEHNYEISQAMVNEGVLIYQRSGKPSLDNRRFNIGCGVEGEVTASISTTRDSYYGFKIQRDKIKTNTLCEQLSLPIAPWAEILSAEHVETIFESFKKPFVIKPVGLVGGSGVTTNINTVEQAKQAYQNALDAINAKPRQDWQTKIIAQEQVYGDDYRILVINGKYEIATKRITAFVIGDGKHTIGDLIDILNQDPRRNVQDPTHTLKPIVKDDMLTQFLDEQNLTIDSVPQKGEQVFVRKVASMSQGGTTEDVTDQVHPQIRALVESMAASAHLYVAGVDIICQDITKPLTTDNGSFIEMNSMPESYLNAFPTQGRAHPDIGDKVLRGLMKDKQRTLRVVVIGYRERKYEDIIAMLAKNPDNSRPIDTGNIGYLHDNTIYINGQIMSQDVQIHQATRSLKLNATLGTLIFHYGDMAEVETHGTGFDEIDVLITAPEYGNHQIPTSHQIKLR